jgi:SAM-dependent methyltransferase
MNYSASNHGVPESDNPDRVTRYYKKDFWITENLKFNEPWYRLYKSASIIRKLAGGAERDLLDIGCGPATLKRLLPPNVHYYGLDIAIQQPAPNLIELDITENPIGFKGKTFDIIVAQGLFEYLGKLQSQKFVEISGLLSNGGKFITSYTNFGHRRHLVYRPFSNVRSIDDFGDDLRRHFNVNRVLPASHNWKHAQPNRAFIKAVNLRMNMNVPFISRKLAVEYFFVCSRLSDRL